MNFFDLNLLQIEDAESNRELLEQAQSLGYQCVALNTSCVLTKKGKLPHVKKMDTKGLTLSVFYRLTVATNDCNTLHCLTNPIANEYDIISIVPQSEKLFLQACSSLQVDMISLKMTERLDFHLKRPQVRQALERGITFEITYSPLIQDESMRRNVIANGMDLVQLTKGKGIVVSSGTSRLLELRGPYDVANLGHLFGLKGGDCKAIITSSCKSVVMHSEMRLKTAKGIVSCRKLEAGDTHSKSIGEEMEVGN